MWLTEYTTDQMHNLRTRIKRRKEALRKTSHLSNEGSSKSSSSVEADWQFVNFNPVRYGPRKSLENGEGDAIANAVGSCIAAAVGASLSGSMTNLHLQTASGNGASTTTLTSQTSNVSICSSASSVPGCGSTEDFYEFPTSTNLKQIVSPSSSNNGTSNNGTGNPLVKQQQQQQSNIHDHHDPPEAITKREKDGGLPSKRDSQLRQQQKYLRHSLNSPFDLLPNPIQVQGQPVSSSALSPSGSSKHLSVATRADHSASKAKASSTDSVVVTVSKSNSILSTSSSSSSITSVSTSSGFSSNPVSRSSSTNKGAPPVPQSKFYVPSPCSASSVPPLPPPPSHHHASRPPLPLPREAAYGLSRPHSWDADSATGILVINGREIVYAKKRKDGSNGRHSHSAAAGGASAASSAARSPGTSQNNLHSDNLLLEKRKRNSYHYPYHQPDEQACTANNSGNNNRKVPTPVKHSHHVVLVSPHVGRIPHPPPLPSYSLEECLKRSSSSSGEAFPAPPPRQPKGRVSSRPPPPPPATTALSAFNSRVSAVGSLCLSLINHNSSNHNHNHASDRPLTGSGSSSSNLKGDRRPDTLSEERLENDGLVCEDGELDSVRQEPKRNSNAVGRSESCKEPQRVSKQPRERRKHSDPNLTSKSSDVDLDNQRQLSDANSGSSSSSSLSARSLESPKSSSLELMTHQWRGGREHSETPENPARHSENDSSFNRTIPGWEGDSDIDVEQDPPDWTSDVDAEVLNRLDRVEKKRQEVLNELFHTERLYVRKLKIMDRLFFRPIRNLQLLSPDMINLLFPNLEEILDIHDEFNQSLKKKRTENPLVGDIGPVLLEMFDGDRGMQLKRAASTFCARQQIALEHLREKRKQDTKFRQFLTEAESNPVCRRLGIKDMIPTVMQRLTKYPLLFESLCNCTAPDSIEYKNLQRALELSKEILTSVNFAKKEAEDEERLHEIQKRLDKSYFEKGAERTDHSYNDLRNFDFTRHKLIYDGYLMWRSPRNKGDRAKSDSQDVLLVLLEDMVVLLLKVDDRYVLKMHNFGQGKAERSPAKPIIKLNTLHATRVAADKKAFYLLSKSSQTPFMFELVCSTGEERTLWLQHITRAADDYKNRQESRRSEVHPISNIPPSVSESEDRSKESGEVTDASGPDAAGDATADSTHLHPNSNASNNAKDSSPAPESNQSSPPPSTGARPESPQSPEKGTGEELKRCDSKIHMAFDEKLKLISKLCHIPPEGVAELVVDASSPSDSSSPDAKGAQKPKDAKELVVACIHQVDQLGRLIAAQKVTSENIQMQKEQLSIHKVLNNLLAQLLSEVHRKDEDLELRRQELYRIREQNHGYQERLQAKTKAEQALLVSPVRSPTGSRPNSYVSLSSSSDHHDYTHDDETEVAGKAPLKPQLSAPVASSSSNSTSPHVVPSSASSTTSTNESKPPPVATGAEQQTNPEKSLSPPQHPKPSSDDDDADNGAKLNRSQQKCPQNQRNSASELAQDEFADALEGMVTTDWDSGVETNRESTETEVVAATKNEVDEEEETVQSGSNQQQQSSSSSSTAKEETSSSNNNKVPENGEIAETSGKDGLTNGHNNSQQEILSCASEQNSHSSENNNTTTSSNSASSAGEEIPNGKCATAAVATPVVSAQQQQEATQQS